VSRYRSTILALGTVAQASYAAAFLGVPVLAPQLRDEYALSLTQTGVMLAAFSIGAVLTLLPWGLLADRVGERSVLAAGLGASSVALAFAAYTSEYASLVLLLVLAGGAGASVNAASGRAVMGWFDSSQRGLALGIRQTALPLGGAAAAVALPPIANAGGTKAALLVLACTSLAAALGFQQTALAVASGLAPPLFALLVESTSWAVAFALAATLPLAGAGLMRRIPA